MVAELKAIKLLTKQGYWCAKSLDPQSPFDIVAVDKKGKVRLIDVKVNSYRKANNWKINRSQSKKQKELNIETAIKKFEGRFLICHGTMDMAVNFKNSLNLLKWAKNGRLFDLRTNHTFGTKHPYETKDIPIPLNEVIDETIRFLL